MKGTDLPEIILIATSKLKLNPDNPRQIGKKEFDRLVKSLEDCPEMFRARPLLISRRTGENIIIGGNMRFRAAKNLGYKEMPCVILSEITAEKEREIAIKDNGAFGEWDYDALANSWGDLPLKDWGVDIPADWGADQVEPADAEPQIDKAAELNKKWKVKTGDLFRIGDHRLLCGDSTKREDVEMVMGGEKADMVWTDPPYGVAIVSRQATSARSNSAARALKHGGDLENDDLDHDQLLSFLNMAFRATMDCTRPGAAWYVAAPHGLMGLAFSESLAAIGVWRHSIVWIKDSLVLGRADYHYRHEPIYYGWTPGAAHNPVTDRTQDSVWEFPRPKSSPEHPTMKPVELIARAIANSSANGNCVLDPFLGSGSTMVACQNLSRKCRGIEISPNYCAVILERMATAFPDIKIKKIK